MAVKIRLTQKTVRQEGSVAGSLFAALFFGIFFLAGLFFTYQILKDTYTRARDKMTWIEVDCRILHTGIDERLKDGSMEFSAAATFVYFYDEKEYRGTEFWNHGVYWYNDYETPRDEIAAFPVGETTSCYVNPQNPSEAALRMASTSTGFLIFVPLIFCAVGGGGIYVCLKHRHSGKFRKQPSESEVKKEENFDDEDEDENDEYDDTERVPLSRKARIGWGIVCFALFIGGCLLMNYLAGQTWQMFQAQSWEETPCKIEFVTLITNEASDSDSSDTYKPQVVYSYTYKGKYYKASRYAFLEGSTSDYSAEQKIVDDLENATNPVCYVNPDKPEDAVLNTRFSWAVLFVLFPVVMILIGFFGFKAMLFPKTAADLARDRMRGEQMLKSWGVSPTAFQYSKPAKSTYEQKNDRDSNVFQEAELIVGRKTKFIGVVMMAIFWNAIISVFIVNDFSLFLVPFILVGVGFLVASVYLGLAMRNPKIVVRIAPKKPALKEVLNIQWEFHERPYCVRHLDVFLVSSRLEITTRKEKGETKTDRTWKQIFKMPVFDTINPSDIKYGHVTVSLPEKSPEKNIFPSGGSIRWEIKIHGDIAFYPDINDAFEISIGDNH